MAPAIYQTLRCERSSAILKLDKLAIFDKRYVGLSLYQPYTKIYTAHSHSSYHEFVFLAIIPRYYKRSTNFLTHILRRRTSPDIFATIAVVLPSKHFGASMKFWFNGDVKDIDVSYASSDRTSVISWYTGASATQQPVTSGYRLVLRYNLHVSPHWKYLPPALPLFDNELRRVLLSWRKTPAPMGPRKIAYLFNAQYDSGIPKLSDVKDGDLCVLKALRLGSGESGFEVYLANLELEVHGPAKGQEEYVYAHEYDDGSEAKATDFDMDRTQTWTTLKFGSAFDMDGVPIEMLDPQFDKEFTASQEFIKRPGELENLEDSEIIRKEIEGNPRHVSLAIISTGLRFIII